jgi:DNA-binding XRE family transcriptional regulator
MCTFIARLRWNGNALSAPLLFFCTYGRVRSMQIKPSQCRAARALIDITQGRLAELSGVSKRTIAHFEAGERSPIPANLAALRQALEGSGVEFTNGDQPGVRMNRKE